MSWTEQLGGRGQPTERRIERKSQVERKCHGVFFTGSTELKESTTSSAVKVTVFNIPESLPPPSGTADSLQIKWQPVRNQQRIHFICVVYGPHNCIICPCCCYTFYCLDVEDMVFRSGSHHSRQALIVGRTRDRGRGTCFQRSTQYLASMRGPLH